MSLYQINEGSFELPDAWADRSMNIFAPDESINPEWNIVVSRDKLDEDETLSGYVEKQLAEMPKALPRFRLLVDDETVVNQMTGREIVSTWVGDGGTVRQKQIVFVMNDKSLVFTFTVLERLSSKYENVLNDFVQTFVARRNG